MISRRHFLFGIPFIALSRSRPALAQGRTKAPVVGIIITSPNHPHYETLRKAFRDLGYKEGETIRLEWRFWENQVKQLPSILESLLSIRPDVILALTAPPAVAAKRAVASIPVVFAAVGIDPVALGLVKMLARPGGNVTGLTHIAADLGGKQLEILKEILPNASRIAVLINPDNANATYFDGIERVARLLKIEAFRFNTRDVADLDTAFGSIRQSSVQGLLVQPDPFLLLKRERIAELSAMQRLATVSAFEEEAEAGNLIACGPNLYEHYRHSALYVSKILKGAKPSELPVEQPLQIAVIVNDKTAKNLGLTIPRLVLLRANRVIE